MKVAYFQVSSFITTLHGFSVTHTSQAGHTDDTCHTEVPKEQEISVYNSHLQKWTGGQMNRQRVANTVFSGI